jgi:hypothetical protein
MLARGNGTLRRLGAIGLVGLVLLCAGGCGKSLGHASGTVKFKNGADLPRETTVTFWTADGLSYAATVGDDGSYSISDIPAGDVVVTLTQPVPQFAPGKRQGSKPGPVPPRYKDQKSTPLKYPIQKGGNKIDIVIE